MWPVWLYNIFPHYIINGKIFRKTLLNTKRVFSFSLQLLSETFLILRRNERDIIIIISLHGLGRLTCSDIDALRSFPGASTISSSSGFVVEGVFRQSAVTRSLMVADPILFVFGSYIWYSRDL